MNHAQRIEDLDLRGHNHRPTHAEQVADLIESYTNESVNEFWLSDMELKFGDASVIEAMKRGMFKAMAAGNQLSAMTFAREYQTEIQRRLVARAEAEIERLRGVPCL